MTQETKQIEVTNFETTADGKKIFTQTMAGKIQQYTERKYKIDIAKLVRGAEMTQTVGP